MAMQVQFTVQGVTFADIDFKMNQVVAGFMAGAPAGITASLDTIGVATKVSDQPAGFSDGKVLTLPVYEVTNRYNITDAAQ